jgi:hypothetical protein
VANLKMEGAHLHNCPEVEQLRPCEFFGQGLCPSCYALPLLKLRRATSGHVHKATPRGGVVRLGTYLEVTPAMWADFKAGRGRWDCCDAEWVREDFRTRPYFLITRGLAPLDFYAAVLADPACVNVQVSTDILPDGRIVPDRERLAWFAGQPKAIFRAKSTPENARAWAPLVDGLSIPRARVMETPLREGSHAYGKETPLQRVGWYWRDFLRCNSTCAACPRENGVLACVVRPRTLATLAQRPREEPPRHGLPLHALAWAEETRRALAELGGTARVADLYRWFERRHPGVVAGKPNWQFKVRVAVQRVGVRTEDGKGWRLPTTQLETWGADPLPMAGE